MAELGATDAELAYIFGVDIRSIHRWKAEHREFTEALRAGKEYADNRVERSLFQKAVGYSHDAVKIFLPRDSRKPVIVPYVEHVPPSDTAIIFWLKNRRPAEWRDKREITGADGAPLIPANGLSGLLDALEPEEREFLRGMLERRSRRLIEAAAEDVTEIEGEVSDAGD